MAEIETQEQKLKRLAERRVPAALKALDGVAALAKYKPTQEQAAHIVAYVTSAYERTLEAFATAPAEKPFSL